MRGNKRLFLAAGSIASVGAVVALAVGVTFGLFSTSQAANQSSFATGTLSVGSVVNHECSISNMVPGDESTGYTGADVTGNTQSPKDAACTFTVKYTGSVPADIGLALTPGGSLYDATSHGLQYQIKDDLGDSFTSGGVINGSAGDKLWVAKDAGNGVGGDHTYTITVNYGLPTATGNTYQNLNATLDMTLYAVQSGNNGDPTAQTAGSPSSGINWS
jgi:hypothetical protein